MDLGITRYGGKPTLIEGLPTQVAELITKKLSVIDLVNLIRSTNGLRIYLSDDFFWKSRAQLLEIPLEASPFDNRAVIASGFKTAVGLKVAEL